MNKFFRGILLFLLLIMVPISVQAKSKYNIYLFYGDGCPHCAELEEFFEDYLEEFDNVELIKYEVWNSAENRELLVKVQDELNNHSSGVPYLVIGDKAISGYSKGVHDKKIKQTLEKYLSSKKKVDVIKSIKHGEHIEIENDDEEEKYFDLPILGKVNARQVSLPLIAVVLGFLDGFNPCAMWILLFLITLLINHNDKKKMIILGLTFIIFSGLTYLGFMLTWLNLSMFINHLKVINIAVSIIAFIAGFINLYNFYKSTKKEDGCEVVKPTRRTKIIASIKKIVSEKKFIIALCGIIVLAFSVNIIEMMCSIGLPLIFTQILSLNKLSGLEYCLYMFLYILFFLIDDIVIFLIAIISLKVKGISTKLTKYSHLISGIILLLIGIIMLLKPSLLMFNF